MRPRFPPLARLQLRNSQSAGVMNNFQMRNRIGRVALRQKRVSEQLMDGRGVWTQFGCVLQGSNGCSVVMLLHVWVAQAKEDDCRAGRQIRSLAKRGDSLVESAAIFGVNSGLQQRKRVRGQGRVRRLRLQEQTQPQQRLNHGCTDSSITMN